MANEVLEGLQQFNQSIQGLAQQRALMDASNTVQQIQQSELGDHQKRQALEQYGKQFALQAMGLGVNPEVALQTGKLIGPPQPLIQTELQAAAYGTPEQQANIGKAKDTELQRAIQLKTAEEGFKSEESAKERALRKYIAELNADTASGKLAGREAEANQKRIDKLNDTLAKGQDFKDLQNVTNQLASARSIYAQAKSPTDLAAADQSLKYILAKVRDPATGVRDAELKLAGAGGLRTQAQNYLARLESGQSLTPPERESLLKELDIFQKVYKSSWEGRTAPTRRRIKALGGEVLLPEVGAALEAPTTQAPAAAAVPLFKFIPGRIGQ